MASWKGITWILNCLFDETDFYDDVAPILLDLLPESFFWAQVEIGAPALKKLVTSPTRSWKLAAKAKGDGEPPVCFDCHRLGHTLSFKLTLCDDAWREADGLAGSFEEMTKEFLGAFRDDARFQNDSGVYPDFYPPFEYPHVDPQPEHPLFRFDLVVDILDPRMEALLKRNDRAELAAETKRVCTAKIPKPVRCVEDDQQRILFWTDDLTDEKALAKAASEHERWLDKAIAGRR